VIVQVAIVTIDGARPQISRDAANADKVWSQECGVSVEVVSPSVVDRPELLILSQADCLGEGHVVSAEEAELFALGRQAGTEIVGYYIRGDVAGFAGCAAHPPGRRGFWVGDNASEWTFGHELTHVVGRNPHVEDRENLMYRSTSQIENPPPDLTAEQCARILDDPVLLCIPSIVLNL
jgi:hypothetical protein